VKRSFLLGLLLSLVISGCGSKEVEDKPQVTIKSGSISQGIVVGKELLPYTFIDQFDKEHSLTSDVKKVIFVFTKPTGHLMRVYLGLKEIDYLDKRHIDFIADVSGMPSMIFKMFALPDLKNSQYPIMIIKDKKQSARFRNEEQKNAVMIISLDNKVVQNVKFVTNETDLKNEIDNLY
jgi:hypothetical protein